MGVVKVLVVASPQWMSPTKMFSSWEDRLKGHPVAESRMLLGLPADEDASLSSTLNEYIEIAVKEQAAITYATLKHVEEAISAKGLGDMVVQGSDLYSEVAVTSLWSAAGGVAGEPTKTEWSNDSRAGFNRNTAAIAPEDAKKQPYVVVTFGVSRSALVEHAVAFAVSKGVHVLAQEWAPGQGLQRRGWIDPSNIEAFYPPFKDGARWTAWERILRIKEQRSVTFDIDAVKADAAAFAPHHHDGHVDRCNKCGAEKHRGRCKTADLAKFATA